MHIKGKQLSIAIVTILLISSVHGQNLLPLKISENQFYITTEDKKPFFWLGDTAWELIHRLKREEVDFYLADRSKKGFTIIQTVILAELDGLNTPNAYGEKPLINNDPKKLNEKYFEHVDYVINKASELGIYIGLLPTWGDKFNLKWGSGPVIFNPANAEIYGEILAKRYLKNNNIVWLLGGDRIPETEIQFEIIRSMAEGIRKVDKVHLITYHPSGAQKATDFVNEKWLDLDMFQTGHDRKTKDYKFVSDSRSMQPLRPVINGEPRYENIPDRFWLPGEHDDWLDDSDTRVSAYWSMLSGAAGYTYGCNDIWQMYSMDRSPVINARTGWNDAMQLPGAVHMKHFKNLLISFPWQTMINDQSLILNDNPENQEYIISAIGKNRDFMIVYTPFGKPVHLNLSKMSAEKVLAFWYNPRSGTSIKINDFSSKEKPVFKPWAKGRGSDFVLIVLNNNSSFKVPGLNN